MKFRHMKHARLAAAAMAAIAAFPATPVSAVNRTYIGPASGAGANWNNTANWSGNAVPTGFFDSALITHNDSASRDVLLDIATSVGSLSIGNSGLGSNTLTQGAFNLHVFSGERIGDAANQKGVHTQNGGSNSHSGVLSTGDVAGANGTYNLNAGSISVQGLSSAMYVGRAGTGHFNHAAGSVSVGASESGVTFALGNLAGAVGNYTLAAGATLSVVGDEIIGNNGTATFTHAGTNTIGTSPQAANGRLTIVSAAGSSGTYSLNAGSLIVNGSAYIGGNVSAAGGAGALNLNSAGSTTVTGTLKIWNTTGTGVNLAAGMLSVDTLDTSSNPTRFNWTGGTLNVTGAGGLAVATAGPLGASLTTSAAKPLNVTNALTVAAGGTFVVQDGTPSAGSLSVASGGTLNVQSGTLTTGSVALSGMMSGGGTLTAAVTVNSGGTISPGNAAGAAANLNLAGLNLLSGAKLTLDPGDRIDVTTPNALSITGSTTVTLNGQSTTAPILTYAGALAGSVSNL